jgi:pyruvate/2-oxoacid:ferredoxin oxidoreductase beta subunit
MIAAVTVVGAASPQQPAAPAGKEVCAGCHDQVVAQLDRSAHSTVVLKEGATQVVGCEACHGSGAKHAEAGGGADTIRSSKNLTSADEACATACTRA